MQGTESSVLSHTVGIVMQTVLKLRCWECWFEGPLITKAAVHWVACQVWVADQARLRSLNFVHHQQQAQQPPLTCNPEVVQA